MAEITVMVSRDSVHYGDTDWDDGPRAFTVDSHDDLRAVVLDLARACLPHVHGYRHTWEVLAGQAQRPIGLVLANAEGASVTKERFDLRDGLELHFHYRPAVG